MSTHPVLTSPIEPITPPARRRGSAWNGAWSASVAAAWAATYAVVALVWTTTGRGYPFGAALDAGQVSWLAHVPAAVGAPLVAAVLLVVAATAVTMAATQRAPRRLVLTVGWTVAGVMILVVPGIRLLSIVGYAPMLVADLLFGVWNVDYREVFTWTLANQLWCFVGGLLLARAVLTWQRRTAGSCPACGRSDSTRRTEAAARWGRRAVAVAAAIPVLYALTRFAWLAGIPLGMPEEDLREMHASGVVWAGAGLGAFAVVGAVLTLGLVQRWGEVFPRWLPGLAGRPVPVGLAVVPGALVALLVGSASIGVLSDDRLMAAIGAGDMAVVPLVFWPLWAAALGVATLAYHLRRRGACTRCGRSDTPH